MDQQPVIRLAEPCLADAAALLAVERASLNDTPYDATQIAAILRRPEQQAYLATVNAVAVGFCACFVTGTPFGPRLEIDSLGVVPQQRGRGIATALIVAALRAARQTGIRRFRGVVARDNLASQRAFGRAGLAASERPNAMLVYPIGGREPQPFLPTGWHWERCAPAGHSASSAEPALIAAAPRPDLHRVLDADGRPVAVAECLQVQTLAYRGAWIERFWAPTVRAGRSMARALVEWAKGDQLDEVGYLAPEPGPAHPECPAVLTLVREGYEHGDDYYIYTLADP